MSPEVAQALDWMETSKRGYKAASKRFGIPRETLEAARKGSNSRARTVTPASAREESPRPLAADAGTINLIDWHRNELRDLDVAWGEASPRDMATLTKARMQVVERLRELEAEEAANYDLTSPETLLEAVLGELEKSVHLLDEKQAKRFVQSAETAGRMHDWSVSVDYAAATSAPSSTPITK
jgi:hypothetical protein